MRFTLCCYICGPNQDLFETVFVGRCYLGYFYRVIEDRVVNLDVFILKNIKRSFILYLIMYHLYLPRGFCVTTIRFDKVLSNACILIFNLHIIIILYKSASFLRIPIIQKKHTDFFFISSLI